MGCFMLLGLDPESCLDVPARVAYAVVASSASDNQAVLHFLQNYAVSADERPLDVSLGGVEFKKRLMLGEYDGE